MNKNILGIDLGTSSVKLLLRYGDGTIVKAKAIYEEKTPDGWIAAIRKAAAGLELTAVDAIGLSSQVGTYIINGRDVIGWDAPIGKEELEQLKSKYSRETFIRELAMPHPDITSYPLPRLLYIKNHYQNIQSICQPKDYLCKILAGKCVTDKYSMRGLVHTVNGTYSNFFLRELGIDPTVLPPVLSPESPAGVTTAECKESIGIPEGIPVFVGMNDFFSSLLGMGITNCGDMFDITGTSEHIGILCQDLCADTQMVSGVYFDKFIHYGVTASSGASLDFALREFTPESFSYEGSVAKGSHSPCSGLEKPFSKESASGAFTLNDLDVNEYLKNSPPIFAPYVNGERAPIFDSRTRGVFFGIGSHCTKKELAYSVLEGVVFSLYHIYDCMGMPEGNVIKVSGGASKNPVLNRLKAELFGKEVHTLSESDTSALGAVMIAAKGLGMRCEPESFNPVSVKITPKGSLQAILQKRYHIYKNLYTSLKEEFHAFSQL